MAADNSTSNDVPTEPKWYWLSNEPEGVFKVDHNTGDYLATFDCNPPPGWQSYSKEVNGWLERALSFMEKSQIFEEKYILRMGLFLPMIKGKLDYSWSDQAVDFCNGIVMIDSDNYVNINEMKQYNKR
ncbi:unnamed protein product [Adineta steineri]|uniref:Uncharacterized protein n=1 Tax=Adineta steineri TaxID=433720 RepID=A0A819ZKY6_9BILA|nr:unnamed protein product [Adineta steineri]CAF4178794.1 unnamed protein product [Adineta steineri]